MLLLPPVSSCADALTGRRTEAAVIADPLTARLRKSLLVLILVTRANAFQSRLVRQSLLSAFRRLFREKIPKPVELARASSFYSFPSSPVHAKSGPQSRLQIPHWRGGIGALSAINVVSPSLESAFRH